MSLSQRIGVGSLDPGGCSQPSLPLVPGDLMIFDLIRHPECKWCIYKQADKILTHKIKLLNLVKIKTIFRKHYYKIFQLRSNKINIYVSVLNVIY